MSTSTIRRGEDVRIPPIQRLSESTISRLRSSVNITSLIDCISELVQNSLDAHAKSIKISVNLERNSCVVEDDGWGIPPEDLKLIGERYASSKHAQGPLPTTFGHRGEALASIATNSLLSVTSRARTHRSTQLVRFSYGTRPIYSGLAPEHMRVWGDYKSGTTVKVDTLFGNFPVRLKARENLRETNSEREWEDLRRVLAGLLMSVHGKGVGLTVRDVNASGDGAIKMMVKPKPEGDYGRSKSWEVDVLRQIFGIGEIGSFSDWEWVRARRGPVSIEGWISKVGCASKRYQFLSINAHPLNATNSTLHSELNDTIANSRFGQVEEEVNKENMPNKQRPETQNPIDRWAKCIFRITVEKRENSTVTLGGEGGTDGKAGIEGGNLKAVVDLLQRLVSEFLKSNKLRPRKATSLNSVFKASKAPTSMTRKGKSEATSVTIKEAQPHRQRGSVRPKSATPDTNIPGQHSQVTGQTIIDLEAWTNKAKAARRDQSEEVGRYKPQQASRTLASSILPTLGSTISASSRREAPYNSDLPVISTSQLTEPDANGESFASWTNPVSHREYKINSRTGNVALSKLAPQSSRSDSDSGLGAASSMTNKRLRIAAPERSSNPSPFIRNLLDTWKNPVFAPTAPSIPRIETLDACCTGTHNNRDSFLTTTTLSLQKLSKDDLASANVIAQVDQKFILCRLQNDALILIDQHAASERIRVESLLTTLCAVPTPSSPPSKALLFQLSQHELTLLDRYKPEFSEWGISYTTLPSTENPTISISTLPTTIVKRCEKDPALAIHLLRSNVHHLSDLSSSPRPRDPTGSWIDALPSIPTALVEMINSKACRGAVMFNDVLSIDECRDLVMDLAKRSFPFICAHGRPGVVPVCELGNVGGGVVEGREGCVSAAAWKRFLEKKRGRMEEGGTGKRERVGDTERREEE